jgi:16S rRNA (cytidine1402-2'-O)-methyltransferase
MNPKLSYSLQPALYLVPVPIGNLDDMTIRALKTLQSADIIASEDTRTIGSLLKHFQITPNKLLGVFEHNEQAGAEHIIHCIESGKSVCYASEAGTPCISDPGVVLVRAVVQAGLRVVPLPGAVAATTALIASGCDTSAFTFRGFPPHKKGREEWLRMACRTNETTILYEAPHRLADCLSILAHIAPERTVCIVRELTKLHEEFIRGTVESVAAIMAERAHIKGECVVILDAVVRS